MLAARHDDDEYKAKVLHSNQKCLLTWPSFSLLCVLTPCSGLTASLLRTDRFGVSPLTGLLSSSFSSGPAGFCGLSSLCGLRAKVDKERSSGHSGAALKMPEIRSLLGYPSANTPRDPHIHIHIYVYTHMNAHYRATK